MRTRGYSRFGVTASLAVGAAALLLFFRAPAARADCSVNCLVLPAAPVPAAINTLSVAIGDVNGDGRADLVALTDNTSTNGDAVWVHLQGSDGTLGPPSWSYGAGKPGVIGAGAIAIGDVTGDGRADIVVATVYGLDVFPQLAGGGLGAPVAVSDSVWLAALRIGDFNRDGRLDVAALAKPQPASAQTFDEVHLFLQTSAGGLAAPTTIALGYPGATDLEVADVNGDGRLDLLVGDGPQGGFVILTATASGGFGAPSPVSLGTIPAIDRVEYATAVAAADVDVDGRVDVAVATNYQPGIRLLHQQAGGTFASVDVTFLSSPVVALALRDLSRDGQADLVTVENHALGIWLSSQGTEQRFAVGPQAGGGDSIAFGDLNGDGKPDVVTAGGASSTAGGSAVFYGTAADLVVTGNDPGSALGGGTAKYTMVVTNAGPDATTGVTMNLPPALDYVPTQGVCNTASALCAIGTLPVGASASVTFSLPVTAVDFMHTVASASGYAFDPHPGNNSYDVVTTVIPAADLAVSQDLFPTALTPGDFIHVTNMGPNAAESVTVTFDASSGLRVTNAGGGPDVTGTCEVNFGHMTCALGTLAPGASETIVVALSAASAGTYDVTASVMSASPQDPRTANDYDAQSMTLTATGLGTVGGPTGGHGGTGGGGATGSGGLTGGRPGASGGGGCSCATLRPAERDGASSRVGALALLVMLAVRRRRR